MAAAREHWSERLQRFDRRWIFLVMAVAVVVPLFWPLGLPAKPDAMTKAAYNAVEALPCEPRRAPTSRRRARRAAPGCSSRSTWIRRRRRRSSRSIARWCCT
jgi:hypothetical protein